MYNKKFTTLPISKYATQCFLFWFLNSLLCSPSWSQIQSSCCSLLNAGISGVQHHGPSFFFFNWYWELNLEQAGKAP